MFFAAGCLPLPLQDWCAHPQELAEYRLLQNEMDGYVTADVLDKICTALECNIEDVMEITQNTNT